ncbi:MULTISPECIES: hypothetical protein [Megamonas]|uniref:hypothetical protein n=1 Tax=Megamonas TaxID=158846 RepID=UPI00241D994F|nr:MULTISPECIES: hypothetical protein [Megamonas]
MPKPLFRKKEETKTNNLFSIDFEQKEQHKVNKMSQMTIARILRRRRSKEYIDLIKTLDAGGKVANQHQIEAIINQLKKDFPEISLPSMLVGIISKCYLGGTYEVHTLSILGNIIEHFHRGESLGNTYLEKARSLAMFGGYSFIEVYTDCLRAVDESGDVSVINF